MVGLDMKKIKQKYFIILLLFTSCSQHHLVVQAYCLFVYFKFIIDCLFTGEAFNAISYIGTYPIYGVYLLIYGIVSGIGVCCIFYIIGNFGSLVNSIVTTTRKFMSILFSIYMYQHKCTVVQWMALLITFMTVAYNFLKEHWLNKEVVTKSHTK